jgi:uncharacterized protein YggE
MQATTVAAQGTATTKFNLVTFAVHLNATEKTVPAAKAKLAKQIEALNESLESLKKNLSLEFVKNSVRTWSQTQESHEWNGNKQVFKGHQITYTHYFDIDDLSLVSKVYDALTSLPEIRVNPPVFGLKNHDRLNKRALKAAWKKVEERFNMECEILGLQSGDFQIANWEATYSDSQRSDRVAKGAQAYAASARVGAARAAPESAMMDDEAVESSAGDAAPAIGFTVGLASVTANLEVGYARKGQ